MRKSQAVQWAAESVVITCDCLVMVGFSSGRLEPDFSPSSCCDGLSVMLKITIVYFYIIVKNPVSLNRPEFPILILFALVGMMLMVSANNFLSLFMSIELQSLTLYILVSFSRKDTFSSEAGVKYFIIGSLSTCIFLFGTSLIYGLVGSVSFESISIFMSVSQLVSHLVGQSHRQVDKHGCSNQ